MRFSSKLAMAFAAIFFALSISSPAIASELDDKVYQVCKKWRVDQGGWMPTEDMQHCRNVLKETALHYCVANNHRCVFDEVRESAKAVLQGARLNYSYC